MSWKADLVDPQTNEIETFTVTLDPADYAHSVEKFYGKERLKNTIFDSYEKILLCPGITLANRLPRIPFTSKTDPHPIELKGLKFHFDMAQAIANPSKIPCRICDKSIFYEGYYDNIFSEKRTAVAHLHTYYKSVFGKKVPLQILELKPRMSTAPLASQS